MPVWIHSLNKGRAFAIIQSMVRQAELADFYAITRIRESVALDVDRLKDTDYRIQIQRSGFLLPTGLSIEDFQRNLLSYSVVERKERVAGYLRLSKDQGIPPEAKAFWLRPDLRDVYYSSPHTTIWGIGVLPVAKHHGLATEMLQAAERQARARNECSWLFSEIVTSPVTNLASLVFHEKNGFERIALVEPAQAHGMDGFQNLLYGKRLS